MSRLGAIDRTPQETRRDFQAGESPTYYVDNYGDDVVSLFGPKISQQLEAGVMLAQVISAKRTDTDVDREALHPDHISEVVFVDGTDGHSDQFFFLELAGLFKSGSYPGERVGMSFSIGNIALADHPNPFEPRAPYDTAWRTTSGRSIAERSLDLLESDLARIQNAIESLEGVDPEDIALHRPSSWTADQLDRPTYEAALRGIGISRLRHVIFVGEEPLTDITQEQRRQTSIPWLDGETPLGAQTREMLRDPSFGQLVIGLAATGEAETILGIDR